MASHKVSDCLPLPKVKFFHYFMMTLVLILLFAPSSIFAYPKSEDSKDFQFGVEYFAKPQRKEEEKRPENCEEVVKNSMLCTVCTEPTTNAKYEQCAYNSHPGEEFTFDKPKPAKQNKQRSAKLQQESKRRKDSEESEELDEISDPYSSGFFIGHVGDDESEHYEPSGTEYVSESEKLSKDVKEDDCEEVEKDGMICKVCKNPKTGGNFEKCSFAYQPKEKLYKYSKSKSYGYPKKDDVKRQQKAEKSQSYRRENNGAHDEPYESEATELAEERPEDPQGCHEVVKDSMTCKVCVDPKTKENSEQCWYSYKPDDKMYAYSKSSSFSTPKQTSKRSKN